MELKKHPIADLNKRSSLFLSIGLTVSLALVVMAFEWKSYGEHPLLDPGSLVSDVDDLVDITITIQEPPKPPVVPNKIIEKPNQEKIELDIEFDLDIETTEDDKIEALVSSLEPGDETAEEIRDFTEQMPEPEGGLKAFYRFVSKNIRYPKKAMDLGIEGKVFISFVIDKDGSIQDVTVLKGIGFGCDDEAVRVVRQAPKWKPGRQGGIPVKVRQRLPIEFVLQKY